MACLPPLPAGKPSLSFSAKELESLEISSTENAVALVDLKHARRVTRKCDLHLLPPLFLLWFLTFVDRVNIGNARIQGLEKDLGMNPKGNDFNIALVIFFVPFVLFEVPSNLVLKHVRPSLWLSLEVFLLSIVTIAQGLVTTYGGLVAMRFLIGLFEAGLVPGCVYLLASYYPRFELQWRLSLLLVANALSSAFGGLLAYGIAGMSADRGYSGWRWIFIIEGSVTAVVSIICYFIMPDWPETAHFLNPDDRQLLKTPTSSAAASPTGRSGSGKPLRSLLLPFTSLTPPSIPIYIATCATTYAINLFTPTIVSLLNPTFTPRAAQARVIPIFLVSALLAALTAYASDRLRHRYAFAMTGYTLSLLGWILLLCQAHPLVSVSVRYAALYFVSGGSYMTLPLLWTLLVNNTRGGFERAFATGMQIGLGNLGGVVASLVFVGKEAPAYWTGCWVCAALVGGAAVGLTGWVGGLRWVNGRRDRGVGVRQGEEGWRYVY
ncbi:hypothetical protein MMC13_000375 [Lambiella insularis]|nr:hypothetical protein [Lambiella insularis]